MRAAGVAPNVISDKAAINSCEKGQQWQRTVERLVEVRAARAAPNAINYGAVISAAGADTFRHCF